MSYTEDTYDTRWLCWSCGDLDQLDDNGLCRRCKPEPGELKAAKRVWVIG